MWQYLSNILKCDTQSDDMKDKIDHYLASFETFHQQCNIMPTHSYNYFVPEDSRYIAVRTPPGFINK